MPVTSYTATVRTSLNCNLDSVPFASPPALSYLLPPSRAWLTLLVLLLLLLLLMLSASTSGAMLLSLLLLLFASCALL